MMTAIIVTLIVLLASVSGWGACESGNFTYTGAIARETCPNNVGGNWCYYGACGDGGWGGGVIVSCNDCSICHQGVVQQSAYVFYTGCKCNYRTSGSCGTLAGNDIVTTYCNTRCDNRVDADSVNCVNNGNQWDSISKICRTSSCTPSDTSWLTSSIAACQDIQGSNSYALVDTNDVCEHRGHCCALDSLIDGEGCKWRCESPAATCTTNKGKFEYAIVADTAVSGSDTAYTGLCYNNCFMHASKDSLTGLVTGNVTAVDNTSMAVGTYYPDRFSGIRSDYGGIYTYDFLSDENYEWADSLLSAPCSVGMYRGIKNGKYVYWKSGQPVPAGVTNVVKVK